LPEPESDEPVLNEYSLFWRDHVLLQVGLYPTTTPEACAAACKRIEAALRQRPDFHELDVRGEYESGRQFYLWLHRDFPGDDDLVYIRRMAEAWSRDYDEDAVGWELGLGDY
jgi:hypothetical protein